MTSFPQFSAPLCPGAAELCRSAAEGFGVFEFFVDSISPEGLVLGRNNNNRDIPVGTTFTAVRLSRVHRGPGEFRSEDLGEVGSLSLTLREVHWYSRTIEVVPGGHTAGLRAAGSGLDMLAGLLSELPPRDYLSLTAPVASNAEPGAAADSGA